MKIKQENPEKIREGQEKLAELKKIRGSVFGMHNRVANDPRLLQAFIDQFNCCNVDMKHIPYKYREMIVMAIGAARGVQTTMMVHAENAIKAGAMVEEIGEVLAKADHLQKWAEEVNQYALEQALAGKHFEGWKLVEGRSIRKYADETKVASTLMAAGFDEAMIYQRKLNGITEMEKLVGKKKLAATLGDLLIKPAGKPVLVPESDKREAINTTEAAKADFTNTDDEIASF